MSSRSIEQFVEKWLGSGANKESNFQPFLTKLCEVLGVDHSDPSGPAENFGHVDSFLEKDGHDPDHVTGFLMRCLFTMLAEDVELLPSRSFAKLLDQCRGNLDAFSKALDSLWANMDEGGFDPTHHGRREAVQQVSLRGPRRSACLRDPTGAFDRGRGGKLVGRRASHFLESSWSMPSPRGSGTSSVPTSRLGRT